MSIAAERLRTRFYNDDPSWVNGTEAFGRMVRHDLRPEMRILNLGAGRAPLRCISIIMPESSSALTPINPSPRISGSPARCADWQKDFRSTINRSTWFIWIG
jgi:hypothetical protein